MIKILEKLINLWILITFILLYPLIIFSFLLYSLSHKNFSRNKKKVFNRNLILRTLLIIVMIFIIVKMMNFWLSILISDLVPEKTLIIILKIYNKNSIHRFHEIYITIKIYLKKYNLS